MGAGCGHLSTPLVVMVLLPWAMALVAFLYASVGHAGASGYIAVLALAGWSPALIKPAALLLNALVACLGCWNFLRAGHFPARRFAAVYALAVPMAFAGGWLQLPGPWLERMVGLVLLGSAVYLGWTPQDPPELRPASVPALLGVGGGLGLLAGLTGTGGGVFLTPWLLMVRWCTTRQAAAVSVLFILLNSMAGLAGLLWAKPVALDPLLTQPRLLAIAPAVVVAGALGSRLGSRHWPVSWIRRALTLVLVLAGAKLLGLALLR